MGTQIGSAAMAGEAASSTTAIIPVKRGAALVLCGVEVCCLIPDTHIPVNSGVERMALYLFCPIWTRT